MVKDLDKYSPLVVFKPMFQCVFDMYGLKGEGKKTREEEGKGEGDQVCLSCHDLCVV